MKKLAVPVVLFLSLAALIGFLSTRGDLGTEEEAAAPREGPARFVAEEAPEAVPAPVPAPAEEAVAPTDGGLGFSSQVALVGPAVVKTADIAIVVGKGDFDEGFRQALLVARKHGGFVESSVTEGARSRSGSVVIRVPAASFELALGDLRDIGVRVERESISGHDVTTQFVDLEARLRTWKAQEEVLLRLMAQATTVQDTLRVQRELQNVQLQIESIEGQLRVLRDQTDMATISASIREAGVPADRPEEPGPSLADAWETAVDGFLAVVSAITVGLGYLVPIAFLVGAGWLAVRRLRPRAAGQH